MASMTVGQTKARVIDLLGDQITMSDEDPSGNRSVVHPISGSQTPASLLLSAIEAAQDAISSRVWKPSVITVPGSVNEITLPGDFIEAEGVRELDGGQLLELLPFHVGGVTGTSNGWVLYPSGKITFRNALGAKGATIYYSALWSKPVFVPDPYTLSIDDVVLEPPNTTMNAITMYAAGYCLMNRATSSAVIRQYNTRIDSGVPVDNPLLDMSNAFMKLFDVELKRIPQMQKGNISR